MIARTFALVLLTIAAMCLLAGLGRADNCRAVQRVQHAYAAPVVRHHAHHAAAVVAEYVAVPLIVPAYSVGYAPADGGQALEIEKLRRELLELQVEQLKARQPQALAAPESAHPGVAVLKNECARCHDKAVAPSKGGGLVLVSGGALAELSAEQRLAILDRTSRKQGDEGAMPPAGPLAAESLGSLSDLALTLKTASRK